MSGDLGHPAPSKVVNKQRQIKLLLWQRTGNAQRIRWEGDGAPTRDTDVRELVSASPLPPMIPSPLWPQITTGAERVA